MIYLVTNQKELFKNEVYKIISVEESLKLLNTLTIVGLDTETEGLDPWTKGLKSIQLGNYEFQIVIDTTTISPLVYKEYLESDRLFIGWNLKFDLVHIHSAIEAGIWYNMSKLPIPYIITEHRSNFSRNLITHIKLPYFILF